MFHLLILLSELRMSSELDNTQESKVESLDHFGITAAYVDTLTLVERIDSRLHIAKADEADVQVRYEGIDNPPPLPKRGHSKDHRPDLKQMVLSLTVSGPANLPVWFEGLDGNSQDKTNFHNTLAQIKKFRSLKGKYYDYLDRLSPNFTNWPRSYRETLRLGAEGSAILTFRNRSKKT
jgi:hypothetical protein